MTLSVDIDTSTQARLRREAEKNGVDMAEYARRLIEAGLPPAHPAKSLHELFARWQTEDATTDPATIASRQQEWDELKRGIDAARTSNRKLFP